MWKPEQIDMLKIIYGDDLLTIGDVVVSRDAEQKSCRLIDSNGELLVDEPVLGIGRFLGRGGFHYVVVTSQEVVNCKPRSGSFVSRAATSRHYSNYLIQGSRFDMTNIEAQYTEYHYKIFSSNFGIESAGSTRKNGTNPFRNVVVEVGGKLISMSIDKCLLVSDQDSCRW